MPIYYATYHLHVKIKAPSEIQAKTIAQRTRACIGFDKPILVEVEDDSLIVNLEKVKFYD